MQLMKEVDSFSLSLPKNAVGQNVLQTVSIQSLYSLLVLASLLSRELNIVHCTIPMLTVS